MIDTSLLTLTKVKEKRSMSKLYIPQRNLKKNPFLKQKIITRRKRNQRFIFVKCEAFVNKTSSANLK